MPRKRTVDAFIDLLADAVVRHLQPKQPRRGKLSAAGRERIRAAQKKRWAASKKAKKK